MEYPAGEPGENLLTIQDRHNNCSMRSMNGIRQVNDSQASIALAAPTKSCSQKGQLSA